MVFLNVVIEHRMNGLITIQGKSSTSVKSAKNGIQIRLKQRVFRVLYVRRR